jgi:hypothetical protein
MISWPVRRFQLPAAREVHFLDEVAVQREQQREGVFGHGRVVHAGAERERNAHFGGGRHVDLVHADAVFAEDLQTRHRLLKDGAGDLVVAAKDRVEVADEFEHFLLAERTALPDDFDAGGFEQFMVRTGDVLIGRGGEEDADGVHDVVWLKAGALILHV